MGWREDAQTLSGTASQIEVASVQHAEAVREALDTGAEAIERVAILADYLADVNHTNTDVHDRIAADAAGLRAGDPEVMDRWALWLRTISDNAEGDTST